MHVLITAAAAAAVFSAASRAQTWKPFEDVDTDGDGRISESEARNERKLDFALADLDRNGSISREEYLEVVCRCIGRG